MSASRSFSFMLSIMRAVLLRGAMELCACSSGVGDRLQSRRLRRHRARAHPLTLQTTTTHYKRVVRM